MQLQTEFEQSVVYEAFQTVYEDQVQVGAEALKLEVARGKMSGNVKLIVEAFGGSQLRQLCLFAEQPIRS